MAACPICAGIGAGSGNAAGDASKKFEDLIAALGATNTAGTALQGVLDKLAAAEQATAAAAAIAAKTGHKAADVRRAMAAQAKDAADAARALAAAQEAASKAAQKSAADGAKEGLRAAEKAQTAQEKAAEREVKSFLDRQRKLHAEKLKAAKVTQGGGDDASEAAAKQQELVAAMLASTQSATQTSGAIGKVQAALAKLGPEGQAVAAALGIVTIAVTAVVVSLHALMSRAVEASQAAARLRESWGAFFGTGAAGGARFIGELDKIAAKLPYVGAEIRKWAQPLVEARLRGAQLARAIEAVAAANAMMGESGASAATELIKSLAGAARLNQAVWISPDMLERLAQAGISAEVLAKELGVSEKRLQLSTVKASVLGDVLQRVLIRQGAGSLALVAQTWDSISAKVREGLSSAFAGLGDLVAPFMKELQYLASELFKGSVASQGLGGVLRAVLKPAFELATSGVRALHYALLYTEIAALTVYIALRPLGQWLEKIGVVSFLASWGLLALKWAGGAVLVVVGLLAVAAALLALPFILAAAAIVGIVFAISKLGAAIGAALGFLAALEKAAVTAGVNFVMGLVTSIASGAGAVAAAVKSLAASAVSALLGALQIKSPSQVTARAGYYFHRGFTGEVEAGEQEAQEAGTGLARAATTGLVRAGGAGGGGKGKGGREINFIGCTFGEGVSESLIRDIFHRILEAEAAAGPEPEPAA